MCSESVTDDKSSDDESRSLFEQVEAELSRRSDVSDFEVRPAETNGVVAKVKDSGGTETYHVTLEIHPDGERTLHWASLGDDPDV